VSVEHDHPEGRRVVPRYRGNGRVGNAVIATKAEGDHPPCQHRLKFLFEALVAASIVPGNDIDVPDISHLDVLEHVQIPIEIMSAEQQGILADFLRTSPSRAASEGCNPVVGHSNHRCIGGQCRDIRDIVDRHKGWHVAVNFWNVGWLKRFTHVSPLRGDGLLIGHVTGTHAIMLTWRQLVLHPKHGAGSPHSFQLNFLS
jgi:hypothetical protein